MGQVWMRLKSSWGDGHKRYGGKEAVMRMGMQLRAQIMLVVD
jgi:hypothetical protein